MDRPNTILLVASKIYNRDHFHL